MGNYLAQRIIDGVFTYDFVISRRGELKEEIDKYLKRKNRTELITSDTEE